MGTFLSHFKSRIITGLIVLVPLGLTVLVLKFIWNSIYLLMSPLFNLAVSGMPIGISTYITQLIVVILIIIFLYIFGTFIPTFLGKQSSSLAMNLLERIPFVRGVYRISKLFTGMFTNNDNKETNRVVLIEYPRPGIFAIGIVTGKFITKEKVEKLAVYIPTVPNPTSGFLAIVNEDQVDDTNLDFDQAMQIVISGGLLTEEVSSKQR